jgi:hypothetical protein
MAAAKAPSPEIFAEGLEVDELLREEFLCDALATMALIADGVVDAFLHANMALTNLRVSQMMDASVARNKSMVTTDAWASLVRSMGRVSLLRSMAVSFCYFGFGTDMMRAAHDAMTSWNKAYGAALGDIMAFFFKPHKLRSGLEDSENMAEETRVVALEVLRVADDLSKDVRYLRGMLGFATSVRGN